MLDTIINREYFIKKGIEVYINDMKSGKTLFSRNYSICNALVFSDGNIAALAHISNATSPEILLSGYVNDLLINNNSHLKKIKSIKFHLSNSPN